MSLTDNIHCVLRNKSGEIHSIHPDATVFDALQLMADKEIGALLVVGENGKLEGIISEREYARKVILLGKSSRDTTVREIMRPMQLSVSPSHTIDECMRLMTDNRIRHLPVLEGSSIIGVVSMGDLVHWVISAQEATIAQLHAYVAGSYPN